MEKNNVRMERTGVSEGFIGFIPNLPNQIRGLYHWFGLVWETPQEKPAKFHGSNSKKKQKSSTSWTESANCPRAGACDQRLHHPSAQTHAEGDGFSQMAKPRWFFRWFELEGEATSGVPEDFPQKLIITNP